jgi:hypothetical protein
MADPLLPLDDVSVIGMDDTYGGIFGFPSYQGYRTDQVLANNRRELEDQYGRRPEQPLNIGFGAGGIDAAGPVRMDPFVVTTSPTTGMFDYGFGSTFGTNPFGTPSGTLGGGAGAGGGGEGVVTLPPFVVNETTTAPSSNLNLLGYDATAPFVGPVAPPAATGGGDGVVTLPPVTVTETPVTSTEVPNWFRDYISRIGAVPGVVMPPVTVRPSDTGTTTTPDENVTIPNFPVVRVPSTGTLNLELPTIPGTGPQVTGPAPGGSGTPGAAPGGGGSTTTTGTGTRTGPERDFEKELGITLAGLQKYQPQLLGMYKDLYQSFMPKGLTAAETSGLAQMQADEAKLNRLRQGILSPEDIRTATQGAREAYGARGQVFAPGAIGAEILNREAIRQQREDQARAAYQQSMGNVLNVSNLQTGNIFQPIGNLLSSTFNPLGAYPADVYGTNVNAALARDIADRNKEAAIESARLSGQAQSSAARTAAGGQAVGAVGSAIVAKIMFSCMPGDQCIDTPSGPKPVKDLKGGDIVIGYNGEEAFIMQACSWNQDPTRTFLTITREDGTAFTVCDTHKILGIPAMEWAEGADMAGSRIASITASNGLLTSYDILTNQGGYRIAGVPVNSMIPEIIRLAARFEALSAAQNPA